jgi:hypothetical protein
MCYVFALYNIKTTYSLLLIRQLLELLCDDSRNPQSDFFEVSFLFMRGNCAKYQSIQNEKVNIMQKRHWKLNLCNSLDYDSTK